jgi:hypothetical protein
MQWENYYEDIDLDNYIYGNKDFGESPNIRIGHVENFYSGRGGIRNDWFAPELRSGWGESKEKGIMRKMKDIKKQAWSIFNQIGNDGGIDTDSCFGEMSNLGYDDDEDEM